MAKPLATRADRLTAIEHLRTHYGNFPRDAVVTPRTALEAMITALLIEYDALRAVCAEGQQ
jgi:hypothetical protein